MTSSISPRWRRVQELFERVADLAAPDLWSVLDAECGGDDELRREVVSLLACDHGADAAMRTMISAGIVSLATAAHVGSRVGAYRLVEVIGEGGMGVVYVGERADGQYRGKVAVKVLRSGFASTHLAARFRDERQILALLDHPGIVKLLDGGTTDDGLPYLVMEYIEGVPLAVHAQALSIRGRVELVMRVAQAVQYAHQRLIVHRDLKPSNVLVTHDGTPKLLDFGIAKLLDATDEMTREAQTHTGVALLTPEYASPEQARGDAMTVATDVYSLGAVLYELLSGHPPQQAMGDALETLRHICEVDPPRPSTVVPGAARREIAGDLDNIVARALQKRPVHRYATMGELAEDLRCYLTGRPVAAREATLGYRVHKLLSRHRVAFAIATAVACALATATEVSIDQARRAGSEARRAEQTGRVLLVEEGWQELEHGHYMRALPYLLEAMHSGDNTPAVRFLVARAMQPLARQIVSVDHHEGLNYSATSPDGTLVATAGMRGLRLFTDVGAPTGFEIRIPCGPLLFTRDGRLAVVFGEMIEFYDPVTRTLLHRVRSPLPAPIGLEVSPDDRLMVVSTLQGDVMACELPTDRCYPLHDAVALAFPPGGGRFATSEHGGLIHVRALTGEPLATFELRRGEIVALRFVTGDRLFAGTTEGTLVLVDAQTGAILSEHRGWAGGVELSPDNAELLTWSADGTVQIWNTRSGDLVGVLVGHERYLRSARWSRDARRIVTVGVDNTYRVWDARSGQAEFALETVAPSGRLRGSNGGAIDAAFSRDGKRLITATASELVWWDASRRPLLNDVHIPAWLYSASYSPDEQLVAVSGFLGYIGLYNLAQHTLVFERKAGNGHIFDTEWSPDGRRFVVAGDEGIARVYRADGTLEHDLAGHSGAVNRAAYSMDGMRIATAGNDRTIRLWDASSGKQLMRFTLSDRASAVSWSRDGGLLASAGWDGILQLWDTASLRSVVTIRTNRQLLDMSLSPDHARIATAAHGGEIEIWDVASGNRIASCEGHTGPATIVAWSPDGEILASSADDRTARIWDARTCRRLATLRHRGGTMQVMWSRDGRRLLVTDNAQRFTIWDVEPDKRSLAELDEIVARQVPWKLVDGRLELR